MTQVYDIKGMADKINTLRKTAEELKEISGGIPSVNSNADRILADVRMLEININDVTDLQ